MIKIKDDDGDIRAYKIGDYYLAKHYSWNNYYDWVITKNLDYASGSTIDFNRRLELGDIRFANSYKEGKEELLKIEAK